jgi:hypothetical protein
VKNLNAREVRSVPKRSACPLCGYKELLTEGPDQFCGSCEWDTCAEYVERGLMNNLELAYREHFPAQAEELTTQAEAPECQGVFVDSAPDELKQADFERTA